MESNHEPNSYSINIEVGEDYIDIVHKNNLQLFYLHRYETEDAVESFIHQMIHIDENILNIYKQTMSKYEYSKFKLPQFFHNLKNYDGRLTIQKCYLFEAKRINTLLLTPENFLSFKITRQEYKDSFQFLSDSLYTLIKALSKSNYDSPNIRKCK